MYKEGDIYKEQALYFIGFDKEGRPKYKNIIIDWEIVKVFDGAILCKSISILKDEYMYFKID